MLKLDRALIQGFEHDRDERARWSPAMIALAHEAGLTAVAVGIETNRQLALARELDCSVGQGFLLHPPESPERLRLRESVRGGNVRAMASARATPGQQPAATERRRRRRAPEARGRTRPLRSWSRTGCASGSAPARRSPTCCRRWLSAS